MTKRPPKRKRASDSQQSKNTTRRRRKPDFEVIARSILAAYVAAPSPDLTIGDLTEIAVDLLMDEGYAEKRVREAISSLTQVAPTPYH